MSLDARLRPRLLSLHLTIYRLTSTMMMSIEHRQPDGARNAGRLCNPHHADLECRSLDEGAL
jgi:hypothetical protein